MKFWEKDKLGNKLLKSIKKKIKIGILGGTFDPAHKGHLKISKLAKTKYKLKYVTWAITKKNPFKDKSKLDLNSRIKFAKKIIGNNKFIKIKFYESIIKSNKTIDLIRYLKRKNKFLNIYFIIGADNLINFHKWHKWQLISKSCNILVFDRHGYRARALKTNILKKLIKNKLEFIKFKKINISSSKLRKI
tara:strand:- start:281 stop:850 length:570 start_codon:yes stop_codon:yes gene_type:complete